MSQCDRPEVLDLVEDLQAAIGETAKVLSVSSVTGAGLKDLRKAIADRLLDAGKWGGR
jgi:hypothetical protein